jgi:hypothetical protein
MTRGLTLDVVRRSVDLARAPTGWPRRWQRTIAQVRSKHKRRFAVTLWIRGAAREGDANVIERRNRDRR